MKNEELKMKKGRGAGEKSLTRGRRDAENAVYGG